MQNAKFQLLGELFIINWDFYDHKYVTFGIKCDRRHHKSLDFIGFLNLEKITGIAYRKISTFNIQITI